MRLPRAACAAGVALILCGCSSGHEQDVRSAAERLHTSLRTADGLAACETLSDDAQRQLAQSSGASCASEVVRTKIPAAGTIRDVRVYGTAAQIRYDDDIVFLAEFEDGWKVTAAGCTARAGEPYDCLVQGA